MILPEPIPIQEGDPNAEYHYTEQLRLISSLLQNLRLASRSGAIQNNDKAGNLNAVYAVFSSNGTANTEDTIPHTLNRIPIGYIPVKQDKAATLYDGTTTFTTTNLYLKSSAATVAWTVLVF